MAVFLLFLGLVAAQAFRSLDDGGGGDADPGLVQAIGQGRIVVPGDGQVLVID